MAWISKMWFLAVVAVGEVQFYLRVPPLPTVPGVRICAWHVGSWATSGALRAWGSPTGVMRLEVTCWVVRYRRIWGWGLLDSPSAIKSSFVFSNSTVGVTGAFQHTGLV